MDWGSIGTQVILGIFGLVITALGTVVTMLINKYVKDEKLKNMLNSLNQLLINCVTEVQQTYVDTLKKQGKFDLDAQQQALETCLTKAKDSMTSEMWDWLVANYKDPDSYLRSRIESIIGSFKFKLN